MIKTDWASVASPKANAARFIALARLAHRLDQPTHFISTPLVEINADGARRDERLFEMTAGLAVLKIDDEAFTGPLTFC